MTAGYRQIVVAVDLDGKTSALLKRVRVLEQSGTREITIVAAVPDLRPLYSGHRTELQRFESDVALRAQERLQKACVQAKLNTSKTKILRGELDTVAAIEAKKVNADLIVFGNYDRHGLERFIGGQELGLLHRAHCDLLAVQEHNPSTNYAKPLVAVNMDDFQESALSGARRLCPDVELDVLHVIRPVLGDYNLDPIRLAFGGDDRQRVKDMIKSEMTGLLEKYAPSKLSFAVGTPASRIAKHVSRGGHDLVAINSGVHHGIDWRLGSTAHNVLEFAAVDVLVVRPQLDRTIT